MFWSIALLFFISTALNVSRAQLRVSEDLVECYTNLTMLDRNNLPPTTINVLIDIIRKVEESSAGRNMNLRQMSVMLLHSYRQDGIVYHDPTENHLSASSSNVFPYAPTMHSVYRHNLLLNILPHNNLPKFDNLTLPSHLKCALHHMLSTTVEARLRGDESRCNQLSQYRAFRVPRQASSVQEDVEIIDQAYLKSANKNGHLRQYTPKDDVEYENLVGSELARSTDLPGTSTCPILEGVVKTPSEAVSAGHLVAGIAAGAELQNIPLSQIMKGSTVSQPGVENTVLSIYPATLSGDLAEAVLRQGVSGRTAISVGATGSWNSSQAVRYYMLHSRTNIEMSDPEIRGDIDGFVLGMNVTTFMSRFSSLKLSQILDMYYSSKVGVFDPSLRSCNRRQLYQGISDAELATATYTFTTALDTNMPLGGTIANGLRDLVNNAVTNLRNYATNNLHDAECATLDSTEYTYRMRTNLYLVVDSMWQYETILPAISYIVDSVEVDKYGSSVTLLSPLDGSIIINKTFSPADFYSEYTRERHHTLPSSVNLQSVFLNVRTLMHMELDNERRTNYIGGNSTVLLFLLNSGNLQNDQSVWEEARLLNETVPDLRILFASSSNQNENLFNLVRDMHKDILTVFLTSDGTNVDTIMAPVVKRIGEVGRRIVNPNCGSEFSDNTESGTRNFEENVEPGFINFYSISPNYFYGNNDNRKVVITRTSSTGGTLVVCHSREIPHPRQDMTTDSGEMSCQTIVTTGNVEISLQNACNGYYTINSCPFFYFSVQATTTTTSAYTSTSCTGITCRFPYNIRYQIRIEEFGCFSGGSSVYASIVVTLLAAYVACTSWL